MVETQNIAMVHSDYTRELAPKVEFFKDRIAITSYGGLPEGLNQDDFFSGISVPRNKEIMRIYRDLELVEQLGSGIPRILEAYGKECFNFSENFTRMTFPAGEPAESISKVEKADVGVNVGANVGVNVGVNELYEIIKDHPGLRTKDLKTYFDVTDRTIERWIQQLREDKKIEFRGSAKTGGYFIR